MERIAAILTVSGFVFLASTLLYQQGMLRFSYPDPAAFPVRGIDVSHHQGDVAWREVAAHGIDFAFITATEGGDWIDPRFRENYEEAIAAGLAVGGYHYFTLCTPGLTQAENFIATVPDSALSPVVDLEYVGNCSESSYQSDFATELTTFSNAIEERYGMPPIIYTTRGFYRDHLQNAAGDGYRYWVRDLFGGVSWPEGRSILFHQYASSGRVAGIKGPVDLNVFVGSERDFERLLAEKSL